MLVTPNLAAQGYDSARNVALPSEAREGRRAEGEFGAQVGVFAQNLQQAEKITHDAMVGGADPHSLVQALAATELAVETAVTVRDKVVEAYLEILRMPV